MKYKTDRKYVLRRVIIWSVLAVLLEAVMIGLLNIKHEKQVELYLQQEARSLEKQYQGVFKTFNTTAKLIYDEVLNTSLVTSILSKAYKANLSKQNKLRNELLVSLMPTYRRMKKSDYDQLHFHFPDNRSYLRFHQPREFGDNLTDFRETVVKANETKEFISGFETGRFYNGFRFVFPLSFEGEHVGTVETSISFEALAQQLCKEEQTEYLFALKSEVAESIMSVNEKRTYTECFLNSDYFLKDSGMIIDYCTHSYISRVEELLTENFLEDIQQSMSQGSFFSKYIIDGKNCFVLAFCPIYDFRNEHVGYFFSIEKNDMLPHMLSSLSIQIMISVVLLFLVIVVLAYTVTAKQIIKRQRKDLIALNLTRTHFFSIIAHDLRSPFNTILGFGALVEEAIENKFEDQSKAYIRQLNEASQRAYALLENLLQWSRSQSGGIYLKPMDFSMHFLIHDVFSLNALRAQEKQIVLHNNVPEECVVFADIDSVSTVVRNLVSNAIKFTEQGGEVYLAAKERDGVVVISVKDTGVGMSEDILNSLFTFDPEFGKKGTHEEQGTGLGLVVSKDFIEKNGGEIWVESKEGEGSVFCFSLPLGRLK